MTLEQKIDLLLNRQITKTEFSSVTLQAATPDYGIPIGQGKCKAVILRYNQYERNSRTTLLESTHIYYGDSNRQEFELISNEAGNRIAPFNSEIIFCDNLEDVFVRAASNDDFNKFPLTVQILIYK